MRHIRHPGELLLLLLLLKLVDGVRGGIGDGAGGCAPLLLGDIRRDRRIMGRLLAAVV